MVISVTKSKVNPVPLVIKLRVLRSRLLDKFGDALHLCLVFRCKTLKAYEIHNLRENRVSRRKQLGVVPGAALVPVAERFPFVSILPGTKNIALCSENEVWLNRECEIGEARFEEIDRTTCLNRPHDTGIL